MLWIVVVVLVLLLVAMAIAVQVKRKGASAPVDNDWPYKSRPLLTAPEQVVYYRLVKALPECLIFAQVELSRALEITQRGNNAAWFNRISGKSLDFVVCLKDTSIVAAIEIDDKTHAHERRVKADDTKEKALKAGGIPLIRWRAADLPDDAAIRAAFLS